MSALVLLSMSLVAGQLPDAKGITPVKLVQVPSYCEGVVFDHAGVGYVSHGDTITRQEIFGPVTAVVSFDDVEEAVRMANHT